VSRDARQKYQQPKVVILEKAAAIHRRLGYRQEILIDVGSAPNFGTFLW
jgi:hypothetical protein